MPIATPRHRRNLVLTLVGGLIAFEALTPGLDLCFPPGGLPAALAARQPLPAAPEAALQVGDDPEAAVLTLASASPAIVEALAMAYGEGLPETSPEASDQDADSGTELTPAPTDRGQAPGWVPTERSTPEADERSATPSDSPVRSLYAGFPALRGLDPSTTSPAFTAPALGPADAAGPVVAPEPQVWALLPLGLLGLAAARRRR